MSCRWMQTAVSKSFINKADDDNDDGGSEHQTQNSQMQKETEGDFVW